MSATNFIEAAPFFEIAGYRSDPPQDAVAFEGSPRKHPYDEAKLLLVDVEGGGDPSILEFRLADLVSIDHFTNRVDGEGHSVPMARLWMRRGSFGVRLEPFEVDDPPKSFKESGHLMHTLRSGMGS